ncbi:hypothetical protein B0O99DRAFT_537068 [Bisporella sp. PMI_857]|nr:hypothetical protein B0O99DRAFT_537068 [Bisporella sp. PMI_857]
MSSQILSLAGWTFLPNMVTGWVQSLYYGIIIRAGDPKPQPGSPRWIAHRRRIHIIVVSAYLLYTIYEADWEIRRESDFYQDLGASHTSTDREIKSLFRRLAAKHHPDKVQGSVSGDGYFVHLKQAQDTLLDPAKRFAYERFGPTILEWQRCSSVRDYLIQGLQSIIPYYLVAAFFMYILSIFGYLEWGKYWRWLTMICLCVFELHTISRPQFPQFVSKLLNPILTAFTTHPPYLPFQLIQLFRKMSLTLYIAFSQIGPLLEPPTQTKRSSDPEVQLRDNLNRLEANTKLAEAEAARLMGIEMGPFMGDKEALDGLQSKIGRWLVQNTVRNDPIVRDAIGRSMQKRRVDAPAGAKGNR